MGTGVRISIDASTVLCASNGTVSRHGGDVEDHLLIRDILGFKCKKIMPGGYRSDLLSHRGMHRMMQSSTPAHLRHLQIIVYLPSTVALRKL